ncbi:MAG: FAD-dependent oxidoreductase, partial [Acidobacteria bacterium]|nr:FAD-dependent oxidoreductase [Acidobacteriota bacterium]
MAREVSEITIIGGGLAGSEAAWQLAAQGLRSTLYEMRPAPGLPESGARTRQTPAHRTGWLGELV